MSLISKLQPLFIIGAALLGIAAGYTTGFGEISVHLIEPFLMVLLYFVFLSVDGKKLKEAFKNVRFTATAVLTNFIWTPLFAFVLGLLFFRGSTDMQIGLMMLLATPCTDWYLVFTALSKGNVALGASILPLNLLLQILLLPVYLMVFYGGSVSIAGGSVLLSIVIVLIIPFGLSMLTKRIGRSRESAAKKIDWLKEQGDNAQLLFLCLAVLSMFASESRSMLEHPAMFLRMLIPLALFFTVNFILVRVIGRKLRFSEYDLVPLNFTTLARNSPLALAIAVAAFPDRPLILLALVIGPLIELPVLGIISGVINRLRMRQAAGSR
ncbi:MAG: arsenic resistance protein [Clostridiales bacterium]|nr:arsenic resistance protein [Clostridiales bacterium]